MLNGGMQSGELRVTQLLDHAAREHGGREVVSRWADGTITRSSWGEVAADARRCASALERLGMNRGDRIATLAMNHLAHLIAWYGVPGMGGILHTVNPRLFDDQIAYILNHAEDRVLLYDRAFAPIVERLRPQLGSIEHFIVFDGEDSPFRDLLATGASDQRWAEGGEREPCGLCYTSGTTGEPKGVLYEHRSNILHALSAIQPDILGLATSTAILPIVPLFHANAWGIPFASAAVGAKLVLSASNEAAVLCDLFRDERVTHSAGVPTVWLAMLREWEARGAEDFGPLSRVVIGGSAAPRAVIEAFMARGVRVSHAWGMTETSPIGTAGAEPPDRDRLSFDEQVTIVARQGRVPFGIELRVVDEAGEELPRDGASSGRLQVRGPWVLQRYARAQSDAVDAQGWFDTGDVALLHPDGTMEITDRAKDVIKSGGEWISSIALENAAMSCACVAEAAAVGVPHPTWDERPLLLVVPKPGVQPDPAGIRATLSDRVAKWWLPDEIRFVPELPHTATGKLLKRALREEYRSYQWGQGDG